MIADRRGLAILRPMPILEFLCPKCNRIYDFFAQGDYESKRPVCPRCGHAELRRQISRFAVIRGGKNPHDAQGGKLDGEDDGDPLADPRMEAELMRLMAESEAMDDRDPKQLGRFMRKLAELSGEPPDERMEEAIRRLEAGEDPDAIEDDLGDVFDDPGLMGGMEGGGIGMGRGRGRPTHDDGLYSL